MYPWSDVTFSTYTSSDHSQQQVKITTEMVRIASFDKNIRIEYPVKNKEAALAIIEKLNQLKSSHKNTHQTSL